MKKKEINNSSYTLIGMVGVGKTTLGKAFATRYNMPYIDVDDIIESLFGMNCYHVLQQHGEEAFLKAEEKAILELTITKPSIIITGGSAIYSQVAMDYLKSMSTVLYLKGDPDHILKRLKNLDPRAIIGFQDMSFHMLYNKREKLYKKYADITVPMSSSSNLSEGVESLKEAIQQFI